MMGMSERFTNRVDLSPTTTDYTVSILSNDPGKQFLLLVGIVSKETGAASVGN